MAATLVVLIFISAAIGIARLPRLARIAVIGLLLVAALVVIPLIFG